MKIRESRYTELIVRVKPRLQRYAQKGVAQASYSSGEQPADAAVRAYDARIYTPPGLIQEDTAEGSSAGQSSRPEIAGLHLATTEMLTIHWELYDEYLRTLRPGTPGTPGANSLLQRLVELHSNLESILAGRVGSGLPIRVWWNNEAHELDELPWERVIAGLANRTAPVSLVRGLPADPPPPLVPISGPVRLALIRGAHPIPFGLDEALRSLPTAIQLVDMPGPPQDALQNVLKSGFEMVHVVAYGMLSLAYEGIVDIGFSPGQHYEDRPQDAKLADRFTAQELYSLLRGSRVALIGLTPPGEMKIQRSKSDRSYLPTTYRAFVHFGRSTLPLPTIVTPTEPQSERQVAAFWGSFYRALSDNWNVEHAMMDAMEQSGYPPAALFLRQPNARLFRIYAPTKGAEANYDEASPPQPQTGGEEPTPQPVPPEAMQPTQIASDLQLSQELVKRLNAPSSASGAAQSGSASIHEFLQQETAHQQRLADQLKPWQKLEESEE